MKRHLIAASLAALLTAPAVLADTAPPATLSPYGLSGPAPAQELVHLASTCPSR